MNPEVLLVDDEEHLRTACAQTLELASIKASCFSSTDGVLEQIGRLWNGIIVTITDSGPGIQEAQLAKVFDPFFSTKDVGQGMGLGLSITYGIVKQFGGSIEVSNNRHGGAEFTLSLVAAQSLESRP